MRTLSQTFELGDYTLRQSGIAVPTTKKISPSMQRVPLSEIELLYLKDGTIFNGINKMVQTIMSARHILKSDSQRTLRFFNKFLSDIGHTGLGVTWEALLSMIFQYKFLYGKMWVENIMNKNRSAIVDWDSVDPKSVDYARDSKNQIVLDDMSVPIGYVQTLDYGSILPAKQFVPKDVVLQPNQIYIPREVLSQFKLFTVGDGFYPIGLVEPIYLNSIRKQNVEEALANAIWRLGFPILWAKMGDSVSGYRYTIIKQDEKVRLIKFKDLYDMYTIEEQIINNISIKDISYKNIYTIGYDNNKPIWTKISKVSKHLCSDNLVRLRQPNCETIVTKQHSVYDYNLNLVNAGTNPILKTISEPILDSSENELALKLPENMDNGRFVERQWTIISNILRGSELSAFLKYSAAYIINGYSLLDEDINFNERSNKSIVIKSQNLKYIQDVSDAIKLFSRNVDTSIAESDTLDSYKLVISNKPMFIVSEQYFGDGGILSRIPDEFLILSKEYKHEFINEIFKALDYRYNGRVEKSSVIETQSTQVASSVALILNSLGIDYNIKYTNIRGSEYIILRGGVQSDKSNIEIIDVPSELYVYDIECDEVHNFIDTLGMALCHNTNHEPTMQHVQSTLEKIRDLNFKKEIATPYYVDLSLIESKTSVQLQSHLTYYQDQQVVGLGIPKPYVTSDGSATNRATLSSMSDLFQLTLRDIISKTCDEIRNCLFKPLVIKNGLPDIPVLDWDMVGVDELDRKADRITKYIRSGALTPTPELTRYIKQAEDLE